MIGAPSPEGHVPDLVALLLAREHMDRVSAGATVTYWMPTLNGAGQWLSGLLGTTLIVAALLLSGSVPRVGR
jgi:hypothetical protein